MRYLLIAVLLFPVSLFAQAPKDWGAFTQFIDAKSLAGKKFKLQAAVKVQQIDLSAQAAIWARVDKKDKKVGFFYNMNDKPIRVKEWQVFTIEGKIDKDAEYLVFGGLYYRNGIFYFDDFRLFVETSKNDFEEFVIPGGDFETDSLKHNWIFYSKMNGFSTAVTTESSFSGKNSIRVDGTEFKMPIAFGSNDTVGKYAIVNGVKLYYEEYGNGKPLILLHGNSLSILSFSLQIPELSKHYRVISVDTRGQGKSTEDGKTYTYDLFAEDMKCFLDYLQLDSVNILGWSDGGNTGLIMAIKYPKKVKRLITMGANIFIDSNAVEKNAIDGTISQIKKHNSDTNYTARNSVRLLTMLLTEPNYQFNELRKIQCPVLVMAGEKDVIKIGHTKGIADNIPKSTMLIAPKESHFFPVENPKEFNKIVLDYLTQGELK